MVKEQEVAHLRFGSVSIRVAIDGHYTRERGVQVPTPPPVERDDVAVEQDPGELLEQRLMPLVDDFQFQKSG